MARIPEEQIERLKQEVSIERLAESAGVELKRHGADLLGLCPFHDDKEPSLIITPSKNLWHCLGACNTGGSVIDWVMKANGVSFRHAVELLKADLPSLAASPSPVKRSSVRHLDTPFSPDADDHAALAEVFGYYHETLKQNADALAYLEKRGIASSEAIERFQLGYANRTLAYRLPEKKTKEGGALRGRLQRLGVLRKTGHEHLNGSLVIPIVDSDGQIVQAYGRKVREDLRKGTPAHLYLPGPHQGVWNLDGLKETDEVILCESLIDALTFWCAGFKNVTASYGVNGFTADHLSAFKQHNIKRVLIAYDRDEAGENAARELSEKLIQEGLDCYRIEFPKGMDANGYALQVQPAVKSLGLVIRSAVWLGNGEAPKKPTTEAVVLDVDKSAPDELENFAPENEAAEPAECPAVATPPSPSLVANPQPEPDPLSAQRIPPGPKEIPAEVSEEEIALTFGDRRYRVRGLARNMSYEVLKVNLLASREAPEELGALLHVDTFDLYSARHRTAFIKQAGLELGVKEEVIKHDLGAVLLKLEALQEERISQAQAPKTIGPSMSEEEEAEALALLKSPDLMQRILDDFHTAGVVGEETNKLVGYLAAVSRKLDKPLAVIIQSTSAAGKSSLMDAVLNMIPEEERVQYSAMTGQSLFYMGETNLKNKILAIAEEEGAENASYALKLLQSEGVLTIASTGKDESTGSLITKQYRVEGPVMLFLTTTAIDIDEELMNRCLVLTVNESREQTQAIHAMQRKQQTLEGLLRNEEKKHLIQLHRNAQRLLKPLLVANPFAERLTFIDDKTRTRRDHMKYLSLIRAIALLHQYQREVKTLTHNGQRLEYIEVTLSDIETANRLAHEVLGRTLDELPPQSRRLLLLIEQMAGKACDKLAMSRSDYRFSRREVREYSGWGDTQLKVHLARLAELEYVLIHRGGRGQQFVYELLYDGQGKDGTPFLPGLIDVESLNADYDKKRSGQKVGRSGSGRPLVGERSASGRTAENAEKPDKNRVSGEAEEDEGEKTYIGGNNSSPSYRTSDLHVLAAKGRA
jgi:DNA primase catalytic core